MVQSRQIWLASTSEDDEEILLISKKFGKKPHKPKSQLHPKTLTNRTHKPINKRRKSPKQIDFLISFKLGLPKENAVTNGWF